MLRSKGQHGGIDTELRCPKAQSFCGNLMVGFPGLESTPGSLSFHVTQSWSSLLLDRCFLECCFRTPASLSSGCSLAE